MQEFTFNENNFGGDKRYTGNEALALKIFYLISTNPNTQPEDPNIGLGIRNYIHEYVTSDMLAELNTSFSYQISTYLKDYNPSSSEVTIVSDDTDTRLLNFSATFNNDTDISLSGTFESDRFDALNVTLSL